MKAEPLLAVGGLLAFAGSLILLSRDARSASPSGQKLVPSPTPNPFPNPIPNPLPNPFPNPGPIPPASPMPKLRAGDFIDAVAPDLTKVTPFTVALVSDPLFVAPPYPAKITKVSATVLGYASADSLLVEVNAYSYPGVGADISQGLSRPIPGLVLPVANVLSIVRNEDYIYRRKV